MTESESGLLQRLSSWLDGSGYPLEMKVAAQCRSLGIATFQSEHYLDPDISEPREIDVVGVLARREESGYLRLTLAIECKMSRDKPWVVFTTAAGERPSDILAERGCSRAATDFLDQIANREEIVGIPLFQIPARVGYSLVRAFGDGPDVPYGAMMAAAKAAKALALEATNIRKEYAVAEVVQPVVVVDGRLFECYLSDGGERVVREIDRAVVHWRNPIAGRVHTTLAVVTVVALPEYLADYKRTFDILASSFEDTLSNVLRAEREAKQKRLQRQS